MKLYGEFFENENYDFPIMKAVLFNKKRLIKVFNQEMGISDWKTFLREEYNSGKTLDELKVGVFQNYTNLALKNIVTYKTFTKL